MPDGLLTYFSLRAPVWMLRHLPASALRPDGPGTATNHAPFPFLCLWHVSQSNEEESLPTEMGKGRSEARRGRERERETRREEGKKKGGREGGGGRGRRKVTVYIRVS